jgi:hypothetical protein
MSKTVTDAPQLELADEDERFGLGAERPHAVSKGWINENTGFWR